MQSKLRLRLQIVFRLVVDYDALAFEPHSLRDRILGYGTIHVQHTLKYE